MAFNIPSQWGFAKASPSSAPKTWTRPGDWPVITDTPNEIQFLVSDVGFLTYAIRYSFQNTSGAGNLYIDWGDGGPVDTIPYVDSNNYWITNTYTLGGGTPCSRGYTTWKVRIYYDPGVILNDIFLDSNNGAAIPYNANLITQSCGVLEMYYGDGIPLTNYTGLCQTTNRGLYFNFLEYVKLPSDISAYASSASALSSMFGISLGDAISSLAKVVMPVNTGTTYAMNLDSCFTNCYNLLEITLPATCRINDFSNCFNGCQSLQSVTLPTLSSCFNTAVTWQGVFSNCRLLTTIKNFPTNLPACTTFNSTFSNCYSLNNITIPTFSAVGINFANTFQNCVSLRQVSFSGWTAGTSWVATNTFNACYSLLSITFPVNANFSSISSIFLNCANLRSVVFQSPCSSLTVMDSAFSGCSSLQSVTLPSTVNAAGASMTSLFSNCSVLESFSFPSGIASTSFQATFNNCFSLKSVSLPSSMSLCTTLNNMFLSCATLQSVVFPSSLNAVTTLQTAFSGCTSLQRVVFPATMNACLTMTQAFATCRSLVDVTLPTSMPQCQQFNNTFQNCSNLRTLTMPSTVSASVTTYASLFSGCYSLTTVTMPTTQTTGLTAAGALGLFNRCAALTTVNNLDKIGSNAIGGTIITGFTTASNAATYGIYNLTSINLSCRLSNFFAGGVSTNVNVQPNKVTSVRLTNTGTGQWTGTSPQVDISYTSLSTAAIVTLFNDLAAQGNVVSKTINITSATGAAGLSAADRLIVTSKGWTITG